jgi:hypothetical protein
MGNGTCCIPASVEPDASKALGGGTPCSRSACIRLPLRWGNGRYKNGKADVCIRVALAL